MENNKEWLKAVVETYNNLNKPVEETKETLNEECVECNESAEQLEEAETKKEKDIQRLMDANDISREKAVRIYHHEEERDYRGTRSTHARPNAGLRRESTEQVDDVEELEEEITDEDFLVTLLEDIQEKAEVELTEDEIDYILETVVNVVEGLVEAKKQKKW